MHWRFPVGGKFWKNWQPLHSSPLKSQATLQPTAAFPFIPARGFTGGFSPSMQRINLANHQHGCDTSEKRDTAASAATEMWPKPQHINIHPRLLCKYTVRPVCQHYQVNLIICCPCLGLRGFAHNQYDEPWTVHRLKTPSMPLSQHSNHTLTLSLRSRHMIKVNTWLIFLRSETLKYKQPLISTC